LGSPVPLLLPALEPRRRRKPRPGPRLVAVMVGTFLFFLIGAGLIWTETADGALLRWVARWLLAPWIFFLLMAAFWIGGFLDPAYRAIFRQDWKPLVFVILVLHVGLLAVVCSLVNTLNAAFPTGRDVMIQGPITKLQAHRSKNIWSYDLTLHDTATHQDLTLPIYRADYQSLAIGRLYQRQMHLGLLGIPFQYRRERLEH
ncbi:MAG: hypothetical protein JWO94_170, partial [Verrucomicrobiaceae bacterium]|nr:hypothetical protein [Verrucomicrobiaceae bacterium]